MGADRATLVSRATTYPKSRAAVSRASHKRDLHGDTRAEMLA
jgi:hypothetical protein